MKRGDLIRLTTGKAHLRVLRVDYPWVVARYISSQITIERPISAFIPVSPQRDLLSWTQKRS